MSNNKTLTLFVSLFVVLALIAGVWQSADAAAFVSKNSYSIGNQGVYLPGGLDPNVVWIKKASDAGFAPVKWSRSPIKLYYKSPSGSSSVTPYIMTYVFFNLHSWERRAYDKGKLSIYYYDVSGQTWKTCNTFLVTGKNIPNGRLSCLATQYTIFGIGIPR